VDPCGGVVRPHIRGVSDKVKRYVELGRGLVSQTFKEWSNDKAPRLGAALSYYTAFSLAPVLILVI